MARPSEQAKSMLHRFLAQKRKNSSNDDTYGDKRKRRPHLASEVTTVAECERWRSAVIREISTLVAQIQNADLGEHRIRDLNDMINKLVREKRHWEHQIRALGGPDHTKAHIIANANEDERGAFGVDGYYYFGAAKNLPGVRELFERTEASSKKQTRGELQRLVNADYYGYRDDDDGLLEKLEREAEDALIKQEIACGNFANQNQRNAGDAELKSQALDNRVLIFSNNGNPLEFDPAELVL